MNIIKIAILAVIVIATIGVTIFFAIKEAEKKKRNRTVFVGGIALIIEVLVLLFAFPSYVFISWNKIIMEFAILIIFAASELCSITPNKIGSTKDLFTSFGGLFLVFVGVLTLLALSTNHIKGECITVQEETNVITRVSPTVDPLHHDPTIGYSIDADGNTTYFYYYKHKDIMYRNDISKDYEIYYLTSQEDSYILKNTNTVSYTYSERRDQEPITEVTDTYTLFINSNQMVMINDTE